MKLILVSALAFLASCSTTNNLSQKSGGLNVAVKTNLQADLDIDMSKKIIGKAKHVRILGFHTESSKNYADGVTYDGGSAGGGLFGMFGGGMEESAKSAAAYNATVPNKADVLVAPQYLLKVTSYFFGAYKEVSAQVWGYSGKIRNIKQVETRSNSMAGVQ
ncbi:MAG: hypothetical protein V4598_06605 [Bdellovibrionota bacterium]